MNKNEDRQLKLLKILVQSSKDFKDNIFYNYIKIDRANDPYDAVCIFNNHKKYIQITTMNNLVVGNKDKFQHAKKHSYKFNNNIAYLKKQNVDRRIRKIDESTTDTYDTFSPYLSGEENFDIKYSVKTSGLINATYRCINKKMSKYNLGDKKDKSVLVIIDESDNYIYLKKIISFRGIKEYNVKREIKKWSGKDFFNSVLLKAIEESNFYKDTFFDEIQVYYRTIINDIGDQVYYLANNKIRGILPIEHIANIQLIPLPADKIARRTIIIPFSKKIKSNS